MRKYERIVFKIPKELKDITLLYAGYKGFTTLSSYIKYLMFKEIKNNKREIKELLNEVKKSKELNILNPNLSVDNIIKEISILNKKISLKEKEREYKEYEDLINKFAIGGEMNVVTRGNNKEIPDVYKKLQEILSEKEELKNLEGEVVDIEEED